MIEILVPSIALTVILLGLHVWFGIEIIRRGIIFTDLAIGQMAALGTAFSIMAFDGEMAYLLSLLFALTCASLIALTSRNEKINLEAFIGLLYAIGISGAFLLLSSEPHGMEEFNRVLASDILFTPWSDIVKVAVIYTIIATILWALRGKGGVWFQEILFFSLFAIMVTSSVKVVGALVVFAILIAPAFIAATLQAKRPLLTGWIVGVIMNAIAVVISFHADLPTGYSIVFVNAFFAIVASLFIQLGRFNRRSDL